MTGRPLPMPDDLRADMDAITHDYLDMVDRRKGTGMSDTHNPPDEATDAIERVADAIEKSIEENHHDTFSTLTLHRMARAAIAAMPATPVAVTEADDDIWRELDAWEPSNVMLMPVYSGEIGARAVIASWQADVALSRGRRSVHGEGTTITEAIREAVRNATESRS